MGLHNLLYIGNGVVVHLITRNWCATCCTSKALPKRHQKELDTCPGANGLIAKDKFLTFGKSKKAYKANRSDLHSYPYEMVIKRASSQIGPALFGLCGKNCRDFVESMKYGFQTNKKIEGFAVGKDPSILCLDKKTLEMACLEEDTSRLYEGLDDESDESADYEVIDWSDDHEDFDVSSLDDERNTPNGLTNITLVINNV